jgi:hypothetical protein
MRDALDGMDMRNVGSEMCMFPLLTWLMRGMNLMLPVGFFQGRFLGLLLGFGISPVPYWYWIARPVMSQDGFVDLGEIL